MKKKTMVLGGLMAAVAITGASVAGTYAKYSSTFTSQTATARVAKWDVSVNELKNKGMDTKTFDFNLFGDPDFTASGATGNESTSNPAVVDVAPGDSGNYDIKVKNNSGIAATYKIAFNETNASNIPIKYALVKADESGNFAAPADDTAYKALSTLDINTATDLGDDGKGEVTYRLYWKWVSEDDDSDLALAEADTLATTTVKAVVTVEQKTA